MTDRDDLLSRRATVRISNGIGGYWEGRVVAYADFPTVEIEQDNGRRFVLPQSYRVEEVPEPGTVAIRQLGEAIKLLRYALHLRINGERAPGGDETWAQWDHDAETFLRSLLPPEPGSGDNG